MLKKKYYSLAFTSDLLDENGIYTSDFNFVLGDHLYCGSLVAQVWHFEKSHGISQSAMCGVFFEKMGKKKQA